MEEWFFALLCVLPLKKNEEAGLFIQTKYIKYAVDLTEI